MDNKRTNMRNRNPFAVDPLPKAYYHPSPEKHLNKGEKSTSIQPSYSSEDTGTNNEESRKINPVDEMFLRGTNMYQTRPSRPSDMEDEVNFDESWPCSERPSSVSLNGFEDDSREDLNKYLSRIDSLIGLKQQSDNVDEATMLERRRMPGSSAQGSGVTASRDTGKPSKSKIPVKDTGQGGRKLKARDVKPEDDADTDSSVLQRYINRFRNSAPMSREEREEQSNTASHDFWWLSNGPPPAKTQEKKRDDVDTSHTTPLTTVNLDKYKQLQKLADKQHFPAHIPESPGDKRTIELQERAEKLLERSSSTVLSTDPAVSTEGLGSNTSDMSSLDEYTYRPKFASYLDSEHRPGHHQYADPPLLGQRPQADLDQRVGYQQFVPPPLPGQRPPTGDDPLHQWRLRRRMELAQQSAPQQTPQFDFINKSEQQKKIDQKLEEFKQRLSGRAPARSQVQFTPAPVQQKEHMQTPHRAECGKFHEPQIASPSLHPPKPRSEPVEEIDPHLHLMCDLLPCPHRGQLQGTMQQGTNDQETINQRTSSNTRSNYTDNVETIDNACRSRDEKLDKLGKYKQYLEAEKPDVEETKSETDNFDVDRGKDAKSDRKSGMKSIQEIENMVKNIGAEDDDKRSKKSDQDEDNLSQKSDRKKKREKVGSDNSESDSERSQTKSKHLDKVSDNDVRLKESEDKREKVIKPKHSSSPKNGRKGVSAAIGQVVKEHLFSTSTSTVLSSVDSLPPSASTDRLPWKHKPPSHDQSHNQQIKQLENDEVAYESDEEFSDDNLLQMLRRQRAVYEQQLQEIDHVLNKAESS